MKKITLLMIVFIMSFLLVGCTITSDEPINEDPIGQENQGNENQGNENQGNENQGNENQGNENQGNENQGNENQGNENQGNENQGNENQGNENQGNENNDPVVYVVKFDTYCNTLIDDQEVEENGKIIKPTDPVKDDYAFAGWYYNDKLWDFDNDVVTGNITLSAQWLLLYEAGIFNDNDVINLNVGDVLDILDGVSANDKYGNDVTENIIATYQIPLDEDSHVLEAGTYVITYEITIDGDTYNESRNVIVSESNIVDIATKYVISFDDGTVGSPYNNAKWTQEVYYSSWGSASNQMNCREKNGVRVVNMTSGYNTTYRYTYTDGEVLCKANTVTFKAGNYFDPKQPIPIKIIIIDKEGNSHYAAGDENNFYTFQATDGLVDQEFVFDTTEVVSFRVVCKGGAQAYQYLYFSAITLSFDENAVIPDNGGENGQVTPTPIEEEGRLNLLADMPAVGSDYVSDNWTIEQYQNGWMKINSVQMRIRERNNIAVANFAINTVPMRYTFSKGESLGTFNKISFKFANDWNPTDEICIIMLLTDVNDKQIFLFGSNSGYDKIPVQTLTPYEFEFADAEIKDVQIMVMVIQSSVSSTYLYMGDAYLSYEE